MIWHESVSLIDLPLLASELPTPATFADAPDLRLIYQAASPECFLLCVGKRNFPRDEPYRTARYRLRSHRLPELVR